MDEKKSSSADGETPSGRRSTPSDVSSLAQQESLFRLFVASVRDYALFVLDPQGRISTWNAGAERIKGYRAEEAIGQHFSIFYQHPEATSGKCERELEIAAREGRFQEEGWRVRKDKTLFWAHVIITALRNDDGELVGFAKVTRDLTDRIGAEEQKLRLARSQESERRKDEFLAVIGHELRNPLSPMATAIHLIKTKGAPGCEHEIDVLERQLSQLTRLLDDLMDVSRTLRENLKIDAQPVEISAVLKRALDVSSTHFTTNKQTLSVDVPERGLVVSADLERMTQVFGNILNNAAKYTNSGGRISVRAFRDGPSVAVAIQDTGRGIEPRNHTRVFELFTQGERGLDRRGGGLGVGLAIAKEFVERHGGHIAVESEGADKGSTFTVRLPRYAVMDTPVPFSVQKVPTADSVSSRRVLVVDDNEDGAELIRIALTQLGHTVEVAFDGQTGLTRAESFKPDIVFLDIGLPGLSGYDVVRALRKTSFAKTIPIIAVTGYANASHRNEALSAGFTSHIAKPVDIHMLQMIIATLPS
ncbi:MAG: ATP-binding protein [Polyangiaceae bacterium]